IADVVGGASILYLGGKASNRASERSKFGVRPTDRHSQGRVVATVVAGVGLFVVAGVLSNLAMNDRAEDTDRVKVLSGVQLDTDADHDGILDAEYQVRQA